MSQYFVKLRLIVLPFILIALALIAGYSLLNWLLVIRMHLKIDDEWANIFIPALLPWIPLIIWLRPRIKLLKLRTEGRNDPVTLLIVFCGLSVVGALIAAQLYLSAATATLTPLQNIGEIGVKPASRFYTVKNFYAEKRMARVKPVFDVSGKHNEYFEMAIYVAVPVFNAAADVDAINFRNRLKPAAWLGIKYFQSISNNLEPAQKEKEYKTFAGESQVKFDGLKFTDFTYLDRIPYGNDDRNYLAAINTVDSGAIKDPVVLQPMDTVFRNESGDRWPWVFIALGIGSAILMIALAFIKLRPVAFKEGVLIEKSKIGGYAFDFIKSFAWPRPGFTITPVIINLNLLVFMAMCFWGLGFLSFKGGDLLHWGANRRSDVLAGQYWRLLTNTFLHGGVLHVLFNMYGLLFVGMFLEPLLGSKRFLVIYLLTGLIASAVSIWWHPDTISVGASGAIFGMNGVFLALLTTNLFPKEFQNPFLINTAVFIGYNLLNGLSGGIDNAAHIGGLLSGLLIGYALYPWLKRNTNQQQADEQTPQITNDISDSDRLLS